MQRPSIQSLLYVSSAGMLALSGWLIYHTLQAGTRPTNPSKVGFDIAQRLVEEARERNRKAAIPTNRAWWEQFRDVNITGWIPPPPPTPPPPPGDDEQLAKPLAEIFQLVSVMYHSGRGSGQTQVVIRYHEGAGVELIAATPTVSSDLPVAGNQIRRSRGTAPPPPPRSVPDPFVHHVMVGEHLWAPYTDIVLVGVAEDARSAFFQRNDQPGAEPVQVFRDEMELSRALADKLRGPTRGAPADRRQDHPTRWVPVEHTRIMPDGRVMIGRDDHEMIRVDPRQLLDQVAIRPYRSQTGDPARSGILIERVEPELGRRFGLRQGDVILEVNGVPVRTRAQAIDVGSRQIEQGVTEFRVRIMSMGRIEERSYLIPGGR